MRVLGGAVARARSLGLEIRAILTYRDEAGARSAARDLAALPPADVIAGMGFQPGVGFLEDALLIAPDFPLLANLGLKDASSRASALG